MAMTIDEMIEVLQAVKDGKPVQCRSKDLRENPRWGDILIVSSDPALNFVFYDFRVKPEPKVIYVNEFPSAPHLAYNSELDAKRADLRSAMRIAVPYREVIANDSV